MPLPTLNDIMSPPKPSALSDARCSFPPVTKTNTKFKAKHGNAVWLGHTFTISALGHMNYQFIPAIKNEVSYCVVPGSGHGEIYVVSDQYGGCEYHELYNATYNILAFLHVYRGDSITTQYTLATGWVLRSVKRSAVIAKAHGMKGSNWSVSHIDRSTNPPTVQSKFIHVEGYPNITVMGEDDGDTPY